MQPCLPCFYVTYCLLMHQGGIEGMKEALKEAPSDGMTFAVKVCKQCAIDFP